MLHQVGNPRQERRRRLLYFVFSASIGISAIICGVLLFFVLTNTGQELVRLGPESRFADASATPVDVGVKRLETSKLIPNRPTLSEDIIFVVRDQEGEFRAFLGTDPSNGCFINWQADERLFKDNCTQNSYGFTGRNIDQLTTSTSRPVNMVELPVTVQDGIVFVQDRILHRDIR